MIYTPNWQYVINTYDSFTYCLIVIIHDYQIFNIMHYNFNLILLSYHIHQLWLMWNVFVQCLCMSVFVYVENQKIE